MFLLEATVDRYLGYSGKDKQLTMPTNQKTTFNQSAKWTLFPFPSLLRRNGQAQRNP
jgi:hypothetical protein